MDYIDRIIAVRVDADDTQRSLGKALDINMFSGQIMNADLTKCPFVI